MTIPASVREQLDEVVRLAAVSAAGLDPWRRKLTGLLVDVVSDVYRLPSGDVPPQEPNIAEDSEMQPDLDDVLGELDAAGFDDAGHHLAKWWRPDEHHDPPEAKGAGRTASPEAAMVVVDAVERAESVIVSTTRALMAEVTDALDKGGDAPQEPSNREQLARDGVDLDAIDSWEASRPPGAPGLDISHPDTGENIQPGCSCGHEWTLWKCSHLVPNDALLAERTWGRPPGGAEAGLRAKVEAVLSDIDEFKDGAKERAADLKERDPFAHERWSGRAHGALAVANWLRDALRASEGAAPPQPNPLTEALTLAVKELNSHHRDASHRTPAYMIAQAEAALVDDLGRTIGEALKPPTSYEVTINGETTTVTLDPPPAQPTEFHEGKPVERDPNCPFDHLGPCHHFDAPEPSGVPDAPGLWRARLRADAGRWHRVAVTHEATGGLAAESGVWAWDVDLRDDGEIEWGGRCTPDADRLAGVERDRDGAAEGLAAAREELAGLRKRVEVVASNLEVLAQGHPAPTMADAIEMLRAAMKEPTNG